MNNTRIQITNDLLQSNLIDDYFDYIQVTDAIKRGGKRDDILQLALFERWPAAYEWLKGRL